MKWMFITFREKSIIESVVRMSAKHTVHSLAAYLDVSARTIQRDLKSVEKLLKQYGLALKRTAAEGLFIEGNDDQVYRLIQSLAAADPADETADEKKLRLLIILLEEGPFFKKQILSSQLGISTTTLTSYLDDLAEWLRKFSVGLYRQRGVGVKVDGQEADKRHALASYFLIYFYEELIESLYLLQGGKESEEKILGFFSPEYLLTVNRVVNQKFNTDQLRLADSDNTGLVLHICLALQRTESGFLLKSSGEREAEPSGEHQLIEAICKELGNLLSVQVSEKDVEFLTMILKGSKVQASGKFYYDSVLLSKLIKNIIRDVSAQLHVDLNNDFSLYQGLLAHMEPSIYRLKQKLESFNPLTGEIKKKYPVLFLAVRQSLEKEFEDLEFPADEIAFIVLHFGSALLMNEEKVRIDAVVVCPTGIGTSKMLASRIQKELPEIDSVNILSINDFQSAKFKDYDLVISTIRLPVTDLDYIMVSPLLSDQDIGFIETYLQNNIEKVIRKKQYLPPGETYGEAPIVKNRKNIGKLLEEIKEVQSSMQTILSTFKVIKPQSGKNHWQTLQEVLKAAEKTGIVTDAARALQQLKERETKGGLGIPDTNMALFHCRDQSVREIMFQVIHLSAASPVKGMDGGQVKMRNLLLMLAPLDLKEREQEILSLISSSLIESDAAMMTYSSSNENEIRHKLEDIFFEYLQNNLIKE